jgi:hypothetical protein
MVIRIDRVKYLLIHYKNYLVSKAISNQYLIDTLRYSDILKTHIRDNIEKTTVVKTTYVASLSGLKPLSFPHTVYPHD